MMNLKKIYLLLSIVCCSFLANAQQTLSSKEMVAITPMLPALIDLPADAKNSLGNKLTQMVTQNGFGSFSAQFVLTANVVVLDKQATSTAPVQFVVDLEVSIYVVDVIEQVILDETSFTVKGIDRLENKAVIQAINQISPRSNTVRAFMNGCREKIIDYYNTRIPTLLTKAKSLADRDEYYSALAILSVIPENVDQYPVIAEQMTAFYKKMLDKEATMAIQEAKSKMALKDYSGALDALLNVDPSSNLSADAFKMIDQIKQTIDAEEQKEMEEQLKKYEEEKEMALRMHDDKMALARLQIESAQKIGVEAAKTEANVSESLNKWFLGKFK